MLEKQGIQRNVSGLGNRQPRTRGNMTQLRFHARHPPVLVKPMLVPGLSMTTDQG